MVYFITDGIFTKIGKADDVNKRLKELQTGNPKKLQIKLSIEGGETEEKKLHKVFHRRRMVGEWFIIDFDYDEEFILEIIDLKFENIKVFRTDTSKKITDALILLTSSELDCRVSIKEVSNICELSEVTVRKYLDKCCEGLGFNVAFTNKINTLKDEKLDLMKEAIEKLKHLGLKINKLTISKHSGVSRSTVYKRWEELTKYIL